MARSRRAGVRFFDAASDKEMEEATIRDLHEKGSPATHLARRLIELMEA